MQLLHFYSSFDHPRLRYALDMIFGRWMGCGYRICIDKEEYRAVSGFCVNYSRERLREDEFFIPAGKVLRSPSREKLGIEMSSYRGIPMFFTEKAEGADIPFDLPALVFYLLSRYEEYDTFSPDRHGRFPASESLALRHGFLDRPLVDEWVNFLAAALQRKFTSFVPDTRPFEVLCTYDIDHAWAYRNKGLIHQLAGSGKDLATGRWQDLKQRVGVWMGGEEDPFNTYDYLESLHRKYHFPTRYFFLLPARLKGPDRAISPDNPALRQLLANISERHPVGIHPSYHSMGNPAFLFEEIESLRLITRSKVEHSRQHFLRLAIPETCRMLIEAGIRHDYTMGYADSVGFRASSSRSFLWYDLEKEKTTDLCVHPFQVMDGTLKQYLKLDPENAFEVIKPLIDRVRESGGTFCTVWHNSSFGKPMGWKPWKQVYEKTLAYLGDVN